MIEDSLVCQSTLMFNHYYFFTEAIAAVASMDATPLNIQIIWPQNVPVIGQISKFLGGLRCLNSQLYGLIEPTESRSVIISISQNPC
jgi:hypothetical protein